MVPPLWLHPSPLGSPIEAPSGGVRLPQDLPVAFLGTYVPRRCGIATFTADLCRAVASVASRPDCALARALDDRPQGYDYPPEVRYQIREATLSDYRRAADFLNLAGVDVLSIQHEYGIFGGTAGAYLLELVRHVRLPVVTTLHTVLRRPDEHQRSVIEQLAQLSDRIVVMAETARMFLRESYRIPEERVVTIPHGIPDVPFVDPEFAKDKFGVEGRIVLLSFGLLNPGKGLESVIRAPARESGRQAVERVGGHGTVERLPRLTRGSQGLGDQPSARPTGRPSGAAAARRATGTRRTPRWS